MSSMLSQLKAQKQAARHARIYRDFIRSEAKIGGELFGPVRSGGRREFFCLDEQTWIWHEEWTDANGQRQIVTTRYDIRPNGILKAQDGQGHHYIDATEASNLFKAVQLYMHRVSSEIYGVTA